jgi:DNA-binding SARP family transcriptional activator
VTESSINTEVDDGESGAGTAFCGPYRLEVIGRIELTSIQGETVALPRGKPMALVCYLALHPEGVDRDELADLLWGEKDVSKGRHSVRQALSRIRSDMGPEVFASEAPVKLVSGVVNTDLKELRAAIESGDVDGAERLWRGEPFTGISVNGEDRWEEWVGEVKSAAKRLLVTGLEERALGVVAEGGIDEAIEELRRAALLVPDRVETWVHLIQLQIDYGRVREARTSLADAWSYVDANIYEDRLGPLERRVSMGPDAALMDLDGSVVARESDLAAASARWRSAVEGHSGVLVFEGSTGLGKTRLLEEVSAPVVTPGAQVVRIASPSSEPWSSATEWMRGFSTLRGADEVRGETAETLAALLGVGSEAASAEFSPSGPVLADAFLDLSASVAQAHPTLLLIDDAHAIDAESWRLLARLARFRPSIPLLVVLAWDSREASDQSRENVEDWAVKQWVELRRLRPFTRDEVESLIRLRGWRHEGAIEEAGRQVFDNSKGHPELVFGFLQVLEENRLRPSPLSDETPHIPDLTTLPLSAPLEGYFAEKLADLDEISLDVVRVLGNADYATLQTLEYSTSVDAHELRPIIAELMRREIVEDVGTGVGLVNRAFADLLPASKDGPENRPKDGGEIKGPVSIPAIPGGGGGETVIPKAPPPLPPRDDFSRQAFWQTVRIRATTLSVIAVVFYIVWYVFFR